MAAQTAIAGTVSFDDYAVSPPLSYAAANRYQSLGIVFGAGIPVADVLELEPQNYQYFLNAGGTAPNAMYLSSSTATSIEAHFVVPGTTNPATTDRVRMLAFDSEVGSMLGYVAAYDRDGNLIASSYRTTPSSMGGYLEIEGVGIASIVIGTDSDGAEFDSIVFTTPWGTIPTEESTWGRIKALCR
jgi:hypothetical protein